MYSTGCFCCYVHLSCGKLKLETMNMTLETPLSGTPHSYWNKNTRIKGFLTCMENWFLTTVHITDMINGFQWNESLFLPFIKMQPVHGCVCVFFVKNNYGNGMRRWYSIYNIHESEFDGLNRCWYNDDAVMFQFQTIFANYISCWNQTHLRSKIPNVGILSAQHIAHVDNSNFYNNTLFSQDFCFVIFQTSSPFFPIWITFIPVFFFISCVWRWSVAVEFYHVLFICG